MGARPYDPLGGRFLATDAVEGGNANDYTYVTDPVGMVDLDGMRWKKGKVISGSWSGVIPDFESIFLAACPNYIVALCYNHLGYRVRHWSQTFTNTDTGATITIAGYQKQSVFEFGLGVGVPYTPLGKGVPALGYKRRYSTAQRVATEALVSSLYGSYDLAAWDPRLFAALAFASGARPYF
jgi:hypothetical protein